MQRHWQLLWICAVFIWKRITNMYTLVVNLGIVTRDSDGKQIAPCQSADDADLAAYNTWVEQGNSPAEIYVDEAV